MGGKIIPSLMKNILKFLLLVVLLNGVRYLIGGMIEQYTIMLPMHQPMAEFPFCFNNNFTDHDWATSFFFNFMLWLAVTWLFHLAWPALKGSFITRSLIVFGICCLFFISLAAVYMNHYQEGIRTFYRYSMIDALILFPLLGVANGILYPLLLGKDRQQ